MKVYSHFTNFSVGGLIIIASIIATPNIANSARNLCQIIDVNGNKILVVCPKPGTPRIK